jgi:hypothetical protein
MNKKTQKNGILSILLLILFCYPIFSIFNKPKLLHHIPVLYIYIGMVWIIALVFLAISAEVKPIKRNKKIKDE